MITIQAGYAVVVDDEPANRDFLERLLQMAGFKVTGAGSGEEGLAAARAVPELALALVDQELPDARGIDVIVKMRSDNPEALLIMATMHDDRDLIDRAFAAGCDVFLVKPHGFMELFKRLQEVDSNTSVLRRMVIDQYGPRPYRGPRRVPGQVAPAAPVAVTAPPANPVTAPTSTPVTVSAAPIAAVEKPAETLPAPEAKPVVAAPVAPVSEKPAEASSVPEAKPVEPPAVIVAEKPTEPSMAKVEVIPPVEADKSAVPQQGVTASVPTANLPADPSPQTKITSGAA